MTTLQQKGLVYGALISDSFALGPHWIYDTDLIQEKFAPLSELQEPATPYHSDKLAGNFTHYGDQSLLLLEHVTSRGRLDIQLFKDEWLAFIENNTLYLDHATKTSVELLKASDTVIGSDSNELGGFVRSAMLFALDYVTLDDVLAQTHLTHNDETLDAIATFTYKLLKQILSGKTPSEALDIVYPRSPKVIKDYIDKGLSQIDNKPIDTIKKIGQSCSSDFGFPASIYFIFKYEDDFKEALIQNVYAGGDSAARGMFIGMVLGAYAGYNGLPASWVNGLKDKDRIDVALAKVTLTNEAP